MTELFDSQKMSKHFTSEADDIGIAAAERMNERFGDQVDSIYTSKQCYDHFTKFTSASYRPPTGNGGDIAALAHRTFNAFEKLIRPYNAKMKGPTKFYSRGVVPPYNEGTLSNSSTFLSPSSSSSSMRAEAVATRLLETNKIYKNQPEIRFQTPKDNSTSNNQSSSKSRYENALYYQNIALPPNVRGYGDQGCCT